MAIEAAAVELVSLSKNKPFSFTSTSSILFITDSLSMLTSLAAGPLRQTSYVGGSIWKNLLLLLDNNCCKSIVFQFVYSHCGVIRNEMADKEADESLKRIENFQDYAPIHIDAVKADVKSQLK